MRRHRSRKMSSWRSKEDRKSTRLNSSHTEIYTLSLHDALPIFDGPGDRLVGIHPILMRQCQDASAQVQEDVFMAVQGRSEEHTSELQSHRDLHSFPTRRSSDL